MARRYHFPMRNFNLVLIDDIDINLIDLEHQQEFRMFQNLDHTRPPVSQEFIDEIDWLLRASYDADEAAAANAAINAAATAEEELKF